MSDGVDLVLAAAIGFVGSHLLLSHPWRRPVVGVAGEGGFLAIYAAIAALTLSLLVVAWLHAPVGDLLWPVGDALWAIATVIMLLAAVLLLGSLVRNPAAPSAGAPGALPERARGVYAITRHPMMWSFALWSLSHVLVFPAAKNLVLSGAIALLALAGAALQDRKKDRLQPERWATWRSRTSYWPFAAIAAGRARLGGFGVHALAGGAVVWLAATWLHIPISGWRAGIWRWVG